MFIKRLPRFEYHAPSTIGEALEKISIHNKKGKVFAGGTDKKKEGYWEWVTGEKWEYSNWAGNQPSNDGGSEHALVTGFSGGWNDVPRVTFKRRFIVEWDR